MLCDQCGKEFEKGVSYDKKNFCCGNCLSLYKKSHPPAGEVCEFC